MSRSLKQKGVFKNLEFLIDDTGLLFTKKSRNSENELHFSFEQLKINKASEVEHNKFLIVTACMSTFFTMCLLIAIRTDKTIENSTIIIWSFISIVLFTLYAFSRTKKTYMYTTENKFIEFYSDKPSKEEVSKFIENVISERNLYLLSKYGNINRNLEYGPQLDNLNWLLNSKAMSKKKYDEKLNELNLMFNSNQANSPIGFISKS